MEKKTLKSPQGSQNTEGGIAVYKFEVPFIGETLIYQGDRWKNP